MSIVIFGVSHKTAPIDVRERVALDGEQLPEALRALLQYQGVNEALILSTCNRTELYCAVDDKLNRPLADWLVQYKALEPGVIDSHFYTLENEYAIRHTLKVACGLDSMVLGEPQILGQLKQAYAAAVDGKAAGKQLNKLLQYSFSVAKKVRTETAVGATPVSVAYAAVRLARQIHGDLDAKTALLIGAGETIALVATHLKSQHIQRLVVANRTLARAEELAAEVGGTAIALEDLPAHLAAADIIVTSTASRLPIITKGAVANAIKARRFEPMFIVDLAVPRDVEPEVAEIDDAYLYTVDDLNNVITENMELRSAAAAQAEEIVNLHTQGYMDWLQAQDGNTVIVEYRRQAESIKDELLSKAQRRLAAGEDASSVMTALAHTLVNKLIHHPTAKIREATVEGRSDLVAVARELFALNEKTLPE
ncbi:MAG: glutamyl-tRNA reductase [Gammaproteobacteria bacterium]|nr:glutamyl-tRNA reductase [Gammaproteobacteria bacterium]MBI5619090.1 glutamyl-tRNA reductase [Gammaproteobacteria bacterium]